MAVLTGRLAGRNCGTIVSGATDRLLHGCHAVIPGLPGVGLAYAPAQPLGHAWLIKVPVRHQLSRGTTLDEMAQQVPLVRFRHLTLIPAGEITRPALRLEPTGRNPRHYTVGFDDLARGMKALLSCQRQLTTNPYYDG
jgi:hypothetical protein